MATKKKATARPVKAKSKTRSTAAKSASRKANGRYINPAPAKNRMLTAKDLPAASFEAIHSVPHGLRQKVLQRLIAVAAEAAKKFPDWHDKLLGGKLVLKTAR